MKILVTAGSTIIPIDKVRIISNIFKGKTGTNIANHFASKGHDVTLITSSDPLINYSNHVKHYRTYWELFDTMASLILNNDYDLIIHSAAVSDYEVKDVCIKDADGQLKAIDKSSKVSSSYPELYLKMSPTPKIIDQIRSPWGFTGKLVKFKLQVGISDEELLEIAEKSRVASNADIIVANCLEWAHEKAYIIAGSNIVVTTREDLPRNLDLFLSK